MAELEGGCGCGAVRYRLASKPMFVNCCHCRICQRQTGSAFVLNAIIETDRIAFEGEGVEMSVPAPSGHPQVIFRCKSCGVALWSQYRGMTGLRFVRVGTLDEPAALKPDAHIWTSSKQPWVALPTDTPAFEAVYDLQAVWPAESLARRQAALGQS